MLQKAMKALCLAGVCSLVLLGCGGEEDLRDFVEVSDLRLSALEVVSGGTLLFEEDEVEEFDPNNGGPYRIDIDDQTVSTISLRVVSDLGDKATMALVEVNTGENNEDKTSTITSGETVSFDIQPGGNLVYVRVSSVNTAAEFNYTLQINKISSDAGLADVSFRGLASSSTSDPVIFSAPVSADVTEYDITLQNIFCGGDFAVAPASRQASITINGEAISPFTSRFFNIPEGQTTPVVVGITAEDGTGPSTYTFNITRAALSTDDAAVDATLTSINFSQGSELSGFVCATAQAQFSQVVDNDITAITFSAQTSQSGATMTIGNAVLGDDGNPTLAADQWASENNVALASGAVYDGDILNDLSEGSNYFVITVTAINTDATFTYLGNVLRSVNNQVRVSNAAELQAALRNAEPNQAIVVAAGDYLGEVSAAGAATGSGNENAHFFSDRSGTAETPIFIRPEDATVTLMGNDLTANNVLLLQGDYWRIIDIDFSGAQNGVVLDGANNVLIDSSRISSVGERGLILQNGASNNQMRTGAIDDTGLAPQARDGITEVYGEAIVVGVGAESADNNAFRNISFGRNIANEAIDLKASAINTAIQYNVFSVDNTQATAVAERSIVASTGGALDLSYNLFDYNNIAGGNSNVEQFVWVNTADGTGVEMYQNLFELDGQTIVALNSVGAGVVSVADNALVSGEAVAVSGATDASFMTPSYQIQSATESTRCLATKPVDIVQGDVTTSLDFVLSTTCDTSASQRWVFRNDGDGFVTITQADSAATKLQFGSILGVSFLLPRVDDQTGADESFFLRWRLVYNDDVVSITNRSNGGFISEDEDLEVTEIPIDDIFVRADNVFTSTGGFTLIRQ